MRVSREQAARNRERIVVEASRQFRAHGFDGVGVDGLMKAVGLTHGGFYNHFASKDDLVGEAVARGLDDSAQVQVNQASFDDLLVRYLSASHRDSVDRGCLLAALGGDLARQKPGVRRAVAGYVRGQIERIAGLVTGRTEAMRRERAIATLAALVGALTLARAVEDPDLSNEIITATRAALGAPAVVPIGCVAPLDLAVTTR